MLETIVLLLYPLTIFFMISTLADKWSQTYDHTILNRILVLPDPDMYTLKDCLAPYYSVLSNFYSTF